MTYEIMTYESTTALGFSLFATYHLTSTN